MTHPAAHLLTWPTGNQTAIAGRKPPPQYRGVLVEPLWKDPPLGLVQPDYEAAAAELARWLGPPGDSGLVARAVVDAALGINK